MGISTTKSIDSITLVNVTDVSSNTDFSVESDKVPNKGAVKGYIENVVNPISSSLNDIASDDSFQNNHFESGMSSFLGLKNSGYVGDNGTRLYILPKGTVTTGVGGVIKIFGDDFNADTVNYRDLGIYFSQNQNGELGFNGDGCFYFNSKAAGTKYAKNPDLVFSFQDAHIGGRFVYLQNGGDPRMCLVVGKGQPQIFSPSYIGIVEEIQGDMAFRNNDMIRWVNTSGLPTSGIRYNTNNDLEFLIGNTSVFKLKNTGKGTGKAAIEGVIVQGYKTMSDNATTLDVSNVASVSVGNTVATTITSITGGSSGQKVTLVFTNGQTTIQNNANIKLQGGVDFVAPQYSTLELIYMGTTWYQVSRSVNS